VHTSKEGRHEEGMEQVQKVIYEEVWDETNFTETFGQACSGAR
jgi:hypothetical protein